MSAPIRECSCHLVETVDEPVLPFTDVSWGKLTECLGVWATLDGREKQIASQFDSSERSAGGYHRRCYQKVTDKKRIGQALKRKDKGCLHALASDLDEPTHKKVRHILRSEIKPSSPVERRSQFILPNECIICRKSKTLLDKSSYKRKIERLVTCETNADKLLEAAKLKNDHRILLQIGDLDPVCIEVRYHASCYKQYTKCVYDEDSVKSYRPLSQSFDLFCTEVIEKRLMSNEEVLKISVLTETFIRTVSDTEGIDISTYKNWQLKARLQKKYPNLEFLQPKSNSCEIVFYNDCMDKSVISIPCGDNDTDSEYEQECETFNQQSSSDYSLQDEFAQLYRSALIIRDTISSSPGIETWPPNASDLTLSTCKEIIPTKLFNFLLWCCDISNDFSTEKLDFEGQENQKKVLSLAQDLITLATKGRRLMPKHIALGMTVRHLTGSSKVQQLLNSFGHCVSHSVTLEHDTALAVQQLQRENDIPPGFQPETFTTLVWDNNDFGEETLSGKGTTHNTNGIIIQDSSEIPPTPEKMESVHRDRRRTIEAPPLVIFPFHGQKRIGPVQFKGQTVNFSKDSDIQAEWKMIDQLLFLAKHCQVEVKLPGWTGCNQLLSKESRPLSNIGYLPVIDASPTDKSTVNTILEKSLQIANTLKVPSVVLVMDQAIYAKAQEIRWQGRGEFRDRLIIRLGEFHTSMAFLGAIGKRFEHAGLKDIAIESGIVAEGSITGVMKGHHYNRSIRCHKLIAEAFHHLRLQDYVDQQQPSDYHVITEMMQMTQDDFVEKFSSAMQNETVLKFLKDYQDYVDKRCEENVMYAFWTSYLNMIELLLLFVRATREGNWDLHLSTIREMIPWFFAYGRINYSRYLPVYYLEMTNLPSSHPFVHLNLKNGNFVVKRHESHGFAMTACDQIIEQTFNRDSKTRGGLNGITLNKGAVRRWILSHPERAAIANMCYEMSCTNSESSSSQKELTASRIRTDEQAVQDVISTISHFANPFTCEDNSELFNISSGQVTCEVVKSDLLSAYNKGEKCYQHFVTERLTSDQKDIYDPLSLPSSKTFLDVEKTKKPRSLVASLKEDRQMLSRILIVAQEKGLNLREVLTYPLSSLPPSLANWDGSMVKTMKSALLHEVEKRVPHLVPLSAANLSTDTVLILDAMAMIQQQRNFPETFGQFATSMLQQVVGISLKHHARRVDFVADRYPALSIKQHERQQRASQGETKVRIQRPEQKMPKQMKKFLACGSNKDGLITFIVNEWKNCPPDMFRGVQIYATCGKGCLKLSVSQDETVGSEDVPDLHSDQEEADTRMFLHAVHASKSLPQVNDIIIRTVDTDVFVLALWASTQLQNRLILLLSLANNSRYLDMKMISSTLGFSTVNSLLGLHPFTGCDTVSAFKGKGKLKALKTMLNDHTYMTVFGELGQEWTVPDVVNQDLEMFVCDLYGWKDCSSVDDVRYNCFRFGSLGDTSMPPNRDSLQLHIMRANYQAHIYRSSMKQYICPPSPEQCGWLVSDSHLQIKWKDMDIAPDSVLQSVSCRCKKSSCDSVRCSCKKARIDCTDMCHCEDCHNRHATQCVSDDGEDDS